MGIVLKPLLLSDFWLIPCNAEPAVPINLNRSKSISKGMFFLNVKFITCTPNTSVTNFMETCD